MNPKSSTMIGFASIVHSFGSVNSWIENTLLEFVLIVESSFTIILTVMVESFMK
ncbi:MAG: hypothetical protein J6R59_00305 [Paludibacteraceae bacterium]|nr:hypothetical protein [Paludibacteraceae bacterium]